MTCRSRSTPAPTTLWTLTSDEKLASGEVAFVPKGVQARLMRNGKLLYYTNLCQPG